MEFPQSRHDFIAALIARCNGFEWDAGNIDKNWFGHGVTDAESEEPFGNLPLMLRDDPKHSQIEDRYIALGKTDVNKLLTVVFTIRGDKIRSISARPMSVMDRRDYATQGA
ncbi:MAG TPA: BrnT family toxin [Candidatus Kapabacteria bacterium]|nr:BrnT family toxin [Candidatus Kapabacteria bacterium]